MKMNPSAQEILNEIKSDKHMQRIVITPALQNKLIEGISQTIALCKKLKLTPLEALALLEILRNAIQESMELTDVTVFGFTDEEAKA